MKNIFDCLKKVINEQDGTAFVLMAAALTVMLGMAAMVVDVGGLALEKNRLANACDAAALAASSELPDSLDAKNTAHQYLELNGVLPENADVTVSADGTKVTVEATRSKNLSFARILGLNTGTVRAKASATFGGITSITGIVPLGIPEQTLAYEHEYQLKAAAQDELGPGNFGALQLEMPGAKSYKNNLKYGYDGIVSVGDWISTEPGNMSGPTEDGVNYRLAQCPHTPECTIEHYNPNCPRVCIVPIFDPTSLQGRDEVQIVGFGAFLLKGVGGGGNECNVSGWFLEMVPPDGLKFTVDPEQADYGLHTARLLD